MQEQTSNDKIQFYYNPMSRGRIVHWMLEEVGAPYEIKMLDWAKREHKSPEYLKINPMGKIPAIVHRGVVVTETAAICAYLADAFPQAKLAPVLSDPKRGTYYRWMFFVASSLESAALDRKSPRTTKIESSHLGYGSYDDVVSTLEKAVEGGFILGDQFSAADVLIASTIGWMISQKDLEPKRVFTNYLQKCMDRPAFKRFTEMAGPI